MEYRENKAYDSVKEGFLEDLASEVSRVSEEEVDPMYTLDGCHCPPCGCLRNKWTLILAPAGIGAAGGAFLLTSPL